MVRRLVEAEYGFPDNDKEREGPWAGMTVSGGKWSYDANNGDVIAALADGSQPEGCVQFAFTQENGMEYKLRSSDCSHTRRVVCEQYPLQHLNVETELLLITDGRSNDPKHFASLERMKALYSATGINVSAIGVGRINEDEIRDLTDNTHSSSAKEGNIFYLMSWESVQKFNKIFEKIHKKFENDACLPLNYDHDDVAWTLWSKTMAKHGVSVKQEPEEGFEFNY
ncbi:Oidioi.mRNA.OKI2018_I69.chr2.g6847.t1.cds [Oikopleura dioica]|uniref:Oidioi.mRNA.OKI2018_I69.chr2.g6847.t1.cds n=1 Tax=Oikopleura dioica TaxID=34765 RepID=A0ABN7T4A7_OIKDI|nr:Oidioi.mRNA.OKI2018_I69.chr2.g6847.t1.cds [Oikopleura dioica]